MTVEEKINELQAQIDELKTEVNKRKKTFHIGDEYYTVGNYGNVVAYKYEYRNLDHKFKEFNNMFVSTCNTKEHLQWYVENVLKVQNRLMQLHEQLCPDYFPNWDGESTYYQLVFDLNMHKWVYWGSNYNNRFTVYFTVEAAQEAANILNAEKFMTE